MTEAGINAEFLAWKAAENEVAAKVAAMTGVQSTSYSSYKRNRMSQFLLLQSAMAMPTDADIAELKALKQRAAEALEAYVATRPADPSSGRRATKGGRTPS